MSSVMDIPNFSLAYLGALRDVKYQLASALTFVVWDFLLTIGEEMEYIWRMRRCMFKWFYFYFRYVLLAAQIFHIAVLPHLSSGHTSDFLCMVWYQYTIMILQVSVSMIDIILATRVFALFNRSRTVGILLGILILLQSGITALTLARCTTVEYFEACILPRSRKEIVNPLTGVILMVQSIILGMIIFKHFVGMRLGWGRTPLLSFIVRDATNYYVTMFMVCGISLTIFGADDMRGTAIVFWMTSLYSTIGCRLILNMERFARRNPLDEEILFTSHISL